MFPPHIPRIHIGNHTYFPPPYSNPSLSPGIISALIALSLLALLSLLSTLCLLLFLFHQTLTPPTLHRHPSSSSPSSPAHRSRNQYLLLVTSLLLADAQQSAALLLSLHWLRQHAILAPSPVCTAQAVLLHAGDLGSGLSVLAIAGYTLATSVRGRPVPAVGFIGTLLGLWGLTYALTFGGWAWGGERYWTAAGAWCWVSAEFEDARLWLHYVWVFVAQFGSLGVYLLTFLGLWRRAKGLKGIIGGGGAGRGGAATARAMRRVAGVVALYPAAYIALTLPLSVGRMWSMAHGGRKFSPQLAGVAGSLLASCGWVDSLLYTLTRKRLIGEVDGDG